MKPFTAIFLVIAAAGLTFAGSASGESGVYAYPNGAQDEQLQTQDRFQCHTWAVDQSRFDPTSAQALPAPIHSAPPAQQRYRRNRGPLGIGDGGFFEGSGLLGDAATGAALGAAGGAIAGDAGEGAAIGALAATVFGSLNRASDRAPSRQSSTEYDHAHAREQARLDRLDSERREQHDNYKRAYGACMTARNYTVQ